MVRSLTSPGSDVLGVAGGCWLECERSAAVYEVEGDSVEVYIETPSSRVLLMDVPAGGYVFALGPVEDARMLVTGSDAARLLPRTDEDLDAATLHDSADRWIGGVAALAEGAARKAEQPQPVTDGEHVAVEPEACLCARGRERVWVLLPGVASASLAQTSHTLCGPIAVPLADDLTLSVHGSCTVWAKSTAGLGSSASLLTALARFMPVLAQLCEALARARDEATLDRLHSARQLTAQRRQAGDALLSDVVRSGGQRRLARTASLDTAGMAVALVLDELDMRVDPVRLEQRGESLEDAARLARHAGVRTRAILLPHDWWRGGVGSMLGILETTGQVVALLDRGRRGYLLVDPRDPRQVPVSAELARGIGMRALQLHRPLPDTFSGLSDAARFVAKDLGPDLKTLIGTGLVAGGLASALPLATGMIFDTLIPGAERSLLIQMGIALAAVACVTFVLTMARGLALARVDGRTHDSLQVAMWDRVLRLPSAFFREHSAGDLTERIDGAEAVREAVIGVLLSAGVVLVFSIFNLALMFVYAPALALVAVALTALYVSVTAAVGFIQIRHQRTVARLRGVLTSRVFELLQGINKLRVAGAESRAFARWTGPFAEQQLAVVRAGVIRNNHFTFQATYQVVALATLFAAAGWLNNLDLSPGVLIAFLAAYGIFQAALLDAAGAALGVLAAMPMWERLRSVLETPVEGGAERADPGRLSGRIEVSGLSFGYDPRGAPVLDGIDLVAEAGQSIAIVGPSGGGKSTLFRLLLGFETPLTGTILYDGQDLHSLDPALLRRQVGAVLQDGRMFSGSILDNIRGAHDLSFDHCLAAAEAAGLGPELAAWPMGLYTPVTEGGSTLSGGQQQRILITRALAARPRLLFLDEATSALDNATQSTVTDTFERMGVTRIIIAHRLSTVRAAHCIHFLDGGKFVESGTFHELMDQNGRFASFARRQIV